MSKLQVIMSRPDYFDITYSINPWMKLGNPVIHELAQKQWQILRSTYKNLGFTIHEIPPVKNLPDLVFTTDHGVSIEGTFYLSNFRCKERHPEQTVIKSWCKTQHAPFIHLPAKYFLEGGDILRQNHTLYIGHGFRTSKNTSVWLQQKTQYQVVPLHLVNDNFYHLDTCFFPLDTHTAFYYPDAFDQTSRNLLKSNFASLIPITLAQANSFICNSVVISQNVICQPNTQFEKILKKLSYTPIPLDASEFNKSGGGLHCLSQILS